MLESVFGKPKEGIHKLSFPETAIVDWVLTIVLVIIIAGVISYVRKQHFGLMFLYTFLSIIPFFVLIHWIFGIKTRFNVWLGSIFS